MVMKKAINSIPSLTSLTRNSSGGGTALTAANKSPSRSHPRKALSFSSDLCEIRLIDCLADTPKAKNAMCYDGRELDFLRKKEIKKAKHAQVVAGQGNSIETDEVSWRGFEDIQHSFCRVEKSAEYTTAVVGHYQSQVSQGYSDADELKRVAKDLSKQERERARNLALDDMAHAGIESDKKSRLRKSSSDIGTHGTKDKVPRKGLRKTQTMGGGGLAQLRKSVTGASMMKLASRLSMGKATSSTKRESDASNASIARGTRQTQVWSC